MVARGDEFYLLASLTRERYLQHSKIEFVSPRGHSTSFIEIPKLYHSPLGSPGCPRGRFTGKETISASAWYCFFDSHLQTPLLTLLQ